MKRILLLLIVLGVLTVGGLWWWTRQSLPTLDGELRLPGLTAPVEVLTDGHGVPHVYASGPEDAWFAAGVLHARDRLWQMELYRRAGNGRLSEILGERVLRIDRRMLTLGLRQAAEAEWNAASPVVRAALERYAEGVNAQVAATGGRLRPLEFQILRLTPGPWTPLDSLIVGRLLAWRLAENHQSEIIRHALAARFGADEAMRLAGRYPAGAATILDGPATNDGPSATTAALPRTPVASAAAVSDRGERHDRAADDEWPRGLEWLAPQARRGNSNNWVVSGRRTASGRPLLANDPHLQIEFPGVWYEVHLVAAQLDVIGVTVPGTPFVVIGHNGRIAWGLTNTGADVQDIYIDRIDVANGRYFYQGQWVPVDVQKLAIPVRGGYVDEFEVWRTRHGSIFAEVGVEFEEAPPWLSGGTERSGEKRVFTLRWDAAGGDLAGAFEALNRAGDWASFIAAVERFAAPSQNFVYADVDGNIGYAMSGSLPQRASGNGTMPHDGASGGGDWTGRVPPSSLPRLFNPPRGFISSANNQIDRRGTPFITHDWALPFRATRVHEQIAAAERLDVTAAARLQNDTTSLAAALILTHLDSALAAGRKRNAEEAGLRALEQLRGWDKRVDNRPVVSLYELFEAALWRRIFLDEMGDELFNGFYQWAGAERPAGVYALLDDPSSRWFDDIGTIEQRETRDDIYVTAAADAAQQLSTDYDNLSWSELHTARFDHPLSSAAAPLGWLFNRGPSPVSGDGTTVMRTSYSRMNPFAVWELPSWRQIFDVGDWDASRVVLPGGQSGHPLSPHYFDQNEMWRQGQYRAQPFSRRAVDAVRQYRLLILPQ